MNFASFVIRRPLQSLDQLFDVLSFGEDASIAVNGVKSKERNQKRNPYLIKKPKKSSEPATWAQVVLGAMFVWFMFALGYGVIPHEWLTWCDSKLGLRSDKIELSTRPIKITGQTIRDVVAALLYIIFLGINTWMWMAWQKRGTAKPKATPAAATPEPAGTSAFSRPVTKKD